MREFFPHRSPEAHPKTEGKANPILGGGLGVSLGKESNTED